jgi:hypothetical protein
MMHITKLFLASLISTTTLLASADIAYAEATVINESNYLNGGIGQEESSEIRAKAGDFNLRLYLSEGKSGQSITNVQITVTDKNGNVRINIADGGPMLFLHLENGRYKINAQYNGIIILRNIVISNRRGTNVYLNWKVADSDPGTTIDEVQAQEL